MAAMSKNVLIVDDEPLIRDMLKAALRRKKMPVETAENGEVALEKLKKKPFDIVISDMRMPKISGLQLLEKIRKYYPEIDTIVLTAYGTIEDAVKGMKMGAFDFIEKKDTTILDEVELKVDKLLAHRKLKRKNTDLEEEVKELKKEKKFYSSFIGKNKDMLKLFDTISTVADSTATVFIEGESGTGKELVARALHEQSSRRKKAFIKVNCAAIPDGLIESELFGHEKGAFTGAVKTTKGKFELADGGTILLDEISEMNPLLQAKLLRVLQEREFEKIGDSKTIKLDVRIIASTNRNIHETIKNGNFRSDLYYRLNVINLKIPSLRNRKDDIPLLANFFIKKYNNIHGKKVDVISREALNFLLSNNWVGNVRELENTIERAIVLSKGNILLLDYIISNSSLNKKSSPIEHSPLVSKDADGITSLSKLEEMAIIKALKKYEGNRTKTANSLGISIRTLRNKLNEYRSKGLEFE